MKLIDKAGIYSMPLDVYHSQCCIGPSISSSKLRTIFMHSPAHYWFESEMNTERVEDEDEEEPAEKASFVLGRAAHHLLLGEEAYSTLFIQRPKMAPDGRAWNGNNLTCKAWLADQRNAGRTVVTPQQVRNIRGMAKSLAEHPLVNAGILNGDIERSLIWRDKKTGIWLKSRPDAIPSDSGDVADLKTTSFHGEELDREVRKHRYDMQGALTKWGLKEVLGLTMNSFCLVFVGSKGPWSTDVLAISAEDIEAAERDLRQSVDTFAWCLEHNNWFGPSGTQLDARYVYFPDAVKERHQFRREFLQREISKAEKVTERYGPVDVLMAG